MLPLSGAPDRAGGPADARAVPLVASPTGFGCTVAPVSDDVLGLLAVACSFCGKSHKDVKNVISGRGAYICDECVYACVKLLEEEA